MGIYRPLTKFLEGLPDDLWDARFADIEKVLGFALPKSAHKHPAWWANQTRPFSQTHGWQDAGWETSAVDLSAKRLRFRRREYGGMAAKAYQSRPDPALWERAKRLSGIEDRDELIEAALIALIRREAAKGLIALGGTMPDFTAPPRERPTW